VQQASILAGGWDVDISYMVVDLVGDLPLYVYVQSPCLLAWSLLDLSDLIAPI
jgi:hypothetical protein